MLLFFEFIPPILFLSLYFGGTFLALLGIIIGRTLIEEEGSEKLKIPNLSNTYAPTGSFSLIAYMLRGTSGVSEVLLLALIQKGYLKRNVNDDSILEQVPNHPPIEKLTDYELKIFDCFTHSLSIKQAFEMSILKNAVEEAGSHYEKELVNAGLILPKKTHQNFKSVVTLSFVSLFGIGLARLIWALSMGFTNVGLLILMLAVVIIVSVASTNLISKRITKKGKKYIADLIAAFSPLKSKIKEEYANAQIQGIPSEYLPVVSVFGLSVLADSQDYKRLSTDSGVSCSSGFGGCGSGTDGGSGGDGGSGCGGGGCGGGCGGGGD